MGNGLIFVDGKGVAAGRIEHTHPNVFGAETTDVGENPYTVVTDDYNESDNKFNGRIRNPTSARKDRGLLQKCAGHWCWTTERDIAETEAMNRVHERSRTPPSAGGGIDGATCSEDADLGGPHEGARWSAKRSAEAARPGPDIAGV